MDVVMAMVLGGILFLSGYLLGLVTINHYFLKPALKGWRESVDEWGKAIDELVKIKNIIGKEIAK